MLTSKERAELRARANALETTLIVGKGGISPALLEDVQIQLDNRELVKGKVLETAMLTPREASDAICQATGADGVSVVGNKFVIYRISEKLREQRNQTGRAKRKAVSVAKSNPVRKGAKARRMVAKAERERRNEYFRQQAIDRAIEREREKQLQNDD